MLRATSRHSPNPQELGHMINRSMTTLWPSSARTAAAHKAKRANCATYETEQRETTQFVLTVVADTWVQELRDTETIYTKVAPKDLL